jgi:hypothetical protein
VGEPCFQSHFTFRQSGGSDVVLVEKYEASGNTKALALIKRMSPAAWHHIHLNGHYTFRGNAKLIDLDAIMAGLDLL